ncbi:P-loop containing nucleoside triphosphate hydrolase protein [Athelia psychrophila]|uniref:P-loop containing nucleoside triphosphate hydrolase protein n=1 Tax=Athelia psychrophila TaxID=1759441 RepID=A0A166DXX4_9AGAM|nr:P-loop containing nucleoside triphosphate hydrolase protein [Fibularhizoctonia sp. CBS 109695]
MSSQNSHANLSIKSHAAFIDAPGLSENPAIQPMKAALYFKNVDDFGDWRIILNGRAIQNLREARRGDKYYFKSIYKKMKELSYGYFSADNQKKLNGGSSLGVPIYAARVNDNARLVYQVDCVPDLGNKSESQGKYSYECTKDSFTHTAGRIVIKIFGVFNHNQLERLWDSIGIHLANKGLEYRSKCIYRIPVLPDRYYAPKTWFTEEVPASDVGQTTQLDIPLEDLKELHSLLTLQKFNNFSQAMLNSTSSFNRDHFSPVTIVAGIIADRDVSHVFLVTPQEQRVVDHTSSCYVIGRSGTGKTTTMMFKMLGMENAWKTLASDDLPPIRQIFVTKSRILAGKVQEYFSSLLESLDIGTKSLHELADLAKEEPVGEEDIDQMDPDDDNTDWQKHLPARFSELKDEHFPLFTTTDRLFQMIEADIFGVEAANGSPLREVATTNTGPSRRRTGSFVSYEVFLQGYWDHFPERLTKNLDPALVFSDIIGVIKGSESTMDITPHFLDRATYESLSHRTNSNMVPHRHNIYTAFEYYARLKHNRGDYDSADRAHSILDAFKESGLSVKKKIDYIYVDEVQDNLLIDAKIIRMLCSNPNGLFWAGDTAQTISVGSSFRFEDLKSFLFRVERSLPGNNAANRVTPPTTFQLVTNYRSHGGIVRCARSIIDIITTFWPYAIDSLAPEKGIVDGPKPTFFHGWGSESQGHKQFFADIKEPMDSDIEFGAEQCILVRNHAVRTKLRSEIGNVGTIMTLYDSKGLEFNDVLLYNFFQDSTTDFGKWRVVLNMLESCDFSEPPPVFDNARHAGICSEMKFLYVAITRARKNVWILDDSQKGEPMRMLWKKKTLVDACVPGDIIPRLAVPSTTEVWKEKARSFFRKRRYLYAMEAFEKAHMEHDSLVARAYYLRFEAHKIPIKRGPRGDEASKAAFLSAAEVFLTCAAPAATQKYLIFAGDCFVSSGEDSRAADAYFEAGVYEIAAKLYRKVGCFEDAVNTIQQYPQKIPADVAASIMHAARLVYLRDPYSRRLTTAYKEKLFTTSKDALQFAEDYDLGVARAMLLLNEKRLAEAAEIHHAEGRIEQCIDILLGHLEDRACTDCAANLAVQEMWSHLSFGVPAVNAMANPLFVQWLELAKQLIHVSTITERHRDEIAMFKALVAGNAHDLQQLGLKFDQQENKAAALLCLDHINKTPVPIGEAQTIKKGIELLEPFLVYAQLLHDAACIKDPSRSRTAQRLFAFTPRAEDLFTITRGTFLAGIDAPFIEKDGMRALSSHDLERALKKGLSDHLKVRVMEVHQLCRKARIFSPCLDALIGTCRRKGCRHGHFDSAALDSLWYNDRVRLCILQIQIFQQLHFIDIGPDQGKERIYLVSKFYETLNPYTYHLGCRANLDLERTPVVERALRTVNDWAEYSIYTSHPRHGGFITTFSHAVALSIEYKGERAINYIQRARSMRHPHPQELLHESQNGSWYIMHWLVDFMHGRQPWSADVGVMFVIYVVERHFNINISLLCDIIERLCGSFVICWRLQRLASLHGVVLPRSWLLALTKSGDDERRMKKTERYASILPPVLQLISQLHMGVSLDQLLHDGRSMTDQVGAVRAVFIHRLCRAICLLAYNIRDTDTFNETIIMEFASLNETGRPSHLLYNQYALHFYGFDITTKKKTEILRSEGLGTS